MPHKKLIHITRILGNDVSWNCQRTTISELDETTIEYIVSCIQAGYSSGELHIATNTKRGTVIQGWWHIINWRAIALDLYNELKQRSQTAASVKAIKAFDKEWQF